MKLLKEFKEFAIKGKVIDLAVGVVIGGAFGKIVASLVEDVIMPIVGALIGGIDFSSLAITVGQANIKYGNFMQQILNFLIIAFSIFIFVKAMNAFRKQEEEAPVEPSNEEKLLVEIRDLLKEKK